MKLEFTLENEMPIRTTMTVSDVRQLIKLLEPIANHEEHVDRHLAQGFVRELKEIQRDALWGARAHFTWASDRLDDDK